jgi:hypothetical protein
MSKLQEKPSALKREHSKMKFIIFAMFLGHCCPPEAGSRGPIESGSTALIGTVLLVLVASIIDLFVCRYCYMCPNIAKEFNKYDTEPGKYIKQYTGVNAITKNEFTVDVGYERFLGPEIFFHPEVRLKINIKIQAIFISVVNPDPDLVDSASFWRIRSRIQIQFNQV